LYKSGVFQPIGSFKIAISVRLWELNWVLELEVINDVNTVMIEACNCPTQKNNFFNNDAEDGDIMDILKRSIPVISFFNFSILTLWPPKIPNDILTTDNQVCF